MRFSLLTTALLASVIGMGQPLAEETLTKEEREMVEKLKRHAKLGKARGIALYSTGQEDDPSYVPVKAADAVTQPIEFDVNSWVLRSDQTDNLKTICNVINHLESDSFQIIGHTDASGTNAYNKWLSRERALSVKGHLIEDCGISKERLQAIGVGEDHLLEPEDPLSGENRRVEFQLTGSS